LDEPRRHFFILGRKERIGLAFFSGTTRPSYAVDVVLHL
jgi:hypothetical protein